MMGGIKKRWFGIINGIMTSLLALFGVQSCDPDAEYGCPTADYIFHGKVTDEKGNALSDVKIYAVRDYKTYQDYMNGKFWDGNEFGDEYDAYKLAINGNVLSYLSSTREDGSYSILVRDDCGVSYRDGLLFTGKNVMDVDTLWKDLDLAPLRGGSGWKKGVSDNTMDITMKTK